MPSSSRRRLGLSAQEMFGEASVVPTPPARKSKVKSAEALVKLADHQPLAWRAGYTLGATLARVLSLFRWRSKSKKP